MEGWPEWAERLTAWGTGFPAPPPPRTSWGPSPPVPPTPAPLQPYVQAVSKPTPATSAQASNPLTAPPFPLRQLSFREVKLGATGHSVSQGQGQGWDQTSSPGLVLRWEEGLGKLLDALGCLK